VDAVKVELELKMCKTKARKGFLLKDISIGDSVFLYVFIFKPNAG